MKESSRPASEGGFTAEKLRGTDVDLPDAPDFISLPPKISLAEAVRLNEPLLAQVNSRPGEMERRRQEKVTVPFEL